MLKIFIVETIVTDPFILDLINFFLKLISVIASSERKSLFSLSLFIYPLFIIWRLDFKIKIF